uniref:Arf-GAP domain-containing protein n=1 Tax=Lynx canadensis TaxID=61383 RepID=A0A667I5I8_LYNCA
PWLNAEPGKPAEKWTRAPDRVKGSCLCLPDPDWASYTLGVFICLSCSGIHQNIPQVSKVKSVRLDAWEEAQVEVRPRGDGAAGGHRGTRGGSWNLNSCTWEVTCL